MVSIAGRFWSFGNSEAAEMGFAAAVSIWMRWAFGLAVLLETNYRVDYGSLSQVLNTLYVLGLMSANGYVWWRIRSSGRVDPKWLLALSALDIAALTFSVTISGGFDSRYFPLYYYMLANFAWLFASPYLVFSWATLAGAVYAVVCLVVGDGLDFSLHEEKVLFYRLLGFYAIPVSVTLVTRFERQRRLSAVRREGELSRQRIELSQSIHDTTAQSAYMLGLGLDQLAAMVKGLDRRLGERVRALRTLSTSAMWELRQPIDGGYIFSGGTLSEVLAHHADTFTTITSITAEFVQCGNERDLPPIDRSLLFGIAHNTMTNAFRHSGASTVSIELDFNPERLVLSVSDDGCGLPDGAVDSGHGFANMRSDAKRLDGELLVESGPSGTTVSCLVPYRNP